MKFKRMKLIEEDVMSVDLLKIKEWLDEMEIENYTINKDGTVDVNEGVWIDGKGLTSIPIQFGRVDGSFNCDNNQLTSLEGCPRILTGSFSAAHNQLTSLEGCPKEMRYSFNIFGNPIAAEMSPMEIRKYFKQNGIKILPNDINIRFEISTGKTNNGLSSKDIEDIRKEKGALQRIKNRREQIRSTAKEIDDIYADTYGDQERYSYETYGESNNKRKKMNEDSSDLTGWQARKMDRDSDGQIDAYVDFDDDLGEYCVFGTNSGFCYHYDYSEKDCYNWCEENNFNCH